MSNLILNWLSSIFICLLCCYLYFCICLCPSSCVYLYLTHCLSILCLYIAYWPFGILQIFFKLQWQKVWLLCIHCIQAFDAECTQRSVTFFLWSFFPHFYFKSDFRFLPTSTIQNFFWKHFVIHIFFFFFLSVAAFEVTLEYLFFVCNLL